MKRKKISTFLLALALASGELFYGTAVPVFAGSELFSDRDFETEYQEDECIPIVLNGNTAECNSDGVQISDGMITITAEGTYLIFGELTNGMIIVDTEKESKVRLILNGVSITSETSAPIYVRQADKVFITTVNGTENSGGEITLTSDDDGLNAAGGVDQSGLGGPWGRDPFGNSSGGTILISGGTLHITASADGIDANGSLEITGGAITICGPDQGDTATLDYDTSAVISGGTFIGTGASGMAQTFSASEQGVIAVNTGNLAAGTSVTLTDSQGNTLLSCEPALSFSAVILSSPDLISGETYTLTAGSASQEFTAQ